MRVSESSFRWLDTSHLQDEYAKSQMADSVLQSQIILTDTFDGFEILSGPRFPTGQSVNFDVGDISAGATHHHTELFVLSFPLFL